MVNHQAILRAVAALRKLKEAERSVEEARAELKGQKDYAWATVAITELGWKLENTIMEIAQQIEADRRTSKEG